MSPFDEDYNPDLDLEKDHVYKKDPYSEIPIKDFSYSNLPKNPKKKKNSKKNYYLIIIVIILILGGILSYNLLSSNSKIKSISHSNKPYSSKNTNKSVASSSPTTKYSSTNFSLTVNYPTNWIISDTPTILQITSPITSIVDDHGQTHQGKIIISVSPQAKLPSSLGNTSATAVLNSELINYTSPTPAQDAQTYISFLQYASTNVIGGLDGVYVTGNYGYLKKQTISLTDLSNISPLVRVSFQKCNNKNCTSLSRLTISSNDWGNVNFSNPILNIIKSFQFT